MIAISSLVDSLYISTAALFDFFMRTTRRCSDIVFFLAKRRDGTGAGGDLDISSRGDLICPSLCAHDTPHLPPTVRPSVSLLRYQMKLERRRAAR